MALAPLRALTLAALTLATLTLGALAGCGDPTRVAALEARVAALEAREAGVTGPPTAVTDAASGVLIEALPPSRVLGCVVEVTDGAMAALYAHEARWEAFTDDITALDWAPTSPCRWYTAARVVPFTPQGTKVEVEVVVTRGDHAGRRWRSDLTIEPREVARWSEAERAAALAAGAWAGESTGESAGASTGTGPDAGAADRSPPSEGAHEVGQ